MNKRRDVKNKLALKRLVSIAVLVVCLPFQVHANPTGPTLVSGSALISNPSANVMQVVNTPGTIMNWNDFSIAGGETTRFVQLDAASAVLNRVTGGDPSSILGRLESNGRVFLVNPNGIVFGGSSVVDVAGLIASTRNITNDNFTNGFYLFSDPGQGTVTVESGAQIVTSGTGGQVWLIGNEVNTEAGSHIETPEGQVVMAAAQSVTVGTSDLGAMSFYVQTDTENTISAIGEIVAERGAVGFFADAINFGGKVSARSDAEGMGHITARATSTINVGMDALLDVSAVGNAEAGSIHLEATSRIEVHPGSEVLAESLAGQGGTILLKAYQVDLPAPRYVPWWDEWVIDLYNETNQSVRAFGTDAARDGVVTVEETGSFQYGTTVIQGASRQSTINQSSRADPCCNRQEVGWTSGLAGDGAVLYYVISYPDNPPTIFEPQTQAIQQTFFLARDGQTTSLGAIVPNGPPGQSNNYIEGIWGLSKGGWLVAAMEFSGQSATRVVRVVQANGSVGASWSPGQGVLSVATLPSGAAWVRVIDFDTTTELASRVYSATGSQLTGDDRTAALGSVRGVDVARLAGASASGSGFQRREVSRIENEHDNHSEIIWTYDLVKDAQVLTSLQHSKEESDSQSTQTGLWKVNSVTMITVPPALPLYRVVWESDASLVNTGTTSISHHEPLTGFGGNGALVLSGSSSDQLTETTASTSTFISRTDDSGAFSAHVQSLNVPNDDGHFLPGHDSVTDVYNNAYDRSRSWNSSLARMTRTPLALPNPAASVTGSVGQSIAFDTRPGLATNTDVVLPPIQTPTPPAQPAVDDSAPPTVVTGTGPGASFGGIAGCNSAVCSEAARAMRAVDAARAAELAFHTSESEALNIMAVEALAERTRQVANLSGQELAAREAAEEMAIFRDYGESQRLRDALIDDLQDQAFWGNATPEYVERQADRIKQLFLEFLQREQTMQQMGLYRTDPADMNLYTLVSAMNEEERVEFGRMWVTQMQTGAL